MTDHAPGAVLRGAVDLSSLRNRPQPGAAPVAPSGATSYIIDVNDESFAQILEVSRNVPVVVDLWASWSEQSTQLSPLLETITAELGGRVLLAKVNVDQAPQVVQAFRAQSLPYVVGVVAGQPVPLFQSVVSLEEARDTFGKLLELAATQGVTKTLGGEAAEGEAQEPELPPLHQEAYVAIEAGDYPRAIAAYEKALKENPRDEDARAGLAQVRLLDRVQTLDLQEARAAAAADPRDVQAQFNVADLDVAGGHVEDAFARLLDLFEVLPADERTPVRERLLDLFALVGATDPRVSRARTRLTNLLF